MAGARRCRSGGKIPPRVTKRPCPTDWQDDELMSLTEAAILFWPEGPLRVASLRTAHRKGQLAVAEIAGKFLTTKRAINQMTKDSLRIEPSDAAPKRTPSAGQIVSTPLRDKIRSIVSVNSPATLKSDSSSFPDPESGCPEDPTPTS